MKTYTVLSRTIDGTYAVAASGKTKREAQEIRARINLAGVAARIQKDSERNANAKL